MTVGVLVPWLVFVLIGRRPSCRIGFIVAVLIIVVVVDEGLVDVGGGLGDIFAAGTSTKIAIFIVLDVDIIIEGWIGTYDDGLIFQDGGARYVVSHLFIEDIGWPGVRVCGWRIDGNDQIGHVVVWIVVGVVVAAALLSVACFVDDFSQVLPHLFMLLCNQTCKASVQSKDMFLLY